MKKRALLLDSSYEVREEKTYAKLIVKEDKIDYKFYQYSPYFYTEDKNVQELAEQAGIEIRIKEEEKIVDGEKRRLLKILCSEPGEVRILRERLNNSYETDIPFARRFMIDFGLVPMEDIIYEGNEIIEKIEKQEISNIKLKKIAIDIEVYNPQGAPDPNKDPIIMFSYANNNEARVITWKKPKEDLDFVEVVKGEKELIEKIIEIIDKYELIYGYNSSNFDLLYIEQRAKKNKLKFPKLRKINKGMYSGLTIEKKIHMDVYYSVRFYSRIGLIKTTDYTLDTVYEQVKNVKKERVKGIDMWKIWDSGNIDYFLKYSLSDAKATFELGEMFYELQEEMARTAKLSLFDITMATSSQMVEQLLMYEAKKRGYIIPNKPKERDVRERTRRSVKGAFVKLPEPGIYENLAVLDFRGLYPSIIISYNIDKNTIGKEGYKTPVGYSFSDKELGLIPSVLRELVIKRSKLKKRLKELDRNSEEYKKIYAKSFALKILSNSFYGYLGYARSRWYCKECAESTTALGRKHIMESIEKAKQKGFKVIYADTDSLFLELGDKTKKDVIKFMEEINKELPDMMELELEAFYKRGIFVSKKTEKQGAKKKYALLAEDGTIKIRGFELVRRDWSGIAKKTQMRVLDALLREGSRKKALEIVRETIKNIREHKVDKEDLIIYTQLKKDPNDYLSKSPESSAALKAIKRGKQLGEGSIIAYIIGKKGNSISEKAELAEYVNDYDEEYYINNQIIPAVMKLLKEFGYNEEDLKTNKKQMQLGDFFG